MYIEASSPSNNGDQARLISPVQPATDGTGACIEFWYHMFGQTIGALNIYLRQGDTDTLEWSHFHNSGNLWRYGQRHFTSDTEYQVGVHIMCVFF